jgi:hypothetical protein
MRPNLHDLIKNAHVAKEEKKEEPKQPSFIASSKTLDAASDTVSDELTEYRQLKDDFYKAIKEQQAINTEEKITSDISAGKYLVKGWYKTMVNGGLLLPQMVLGSPDAFKDFALGALSTTPEDIVNYAFEAYRFLHGVDEKDVQEFEARKNTFASLAKATSDKLNPVNMIASSLDSQGSESLFSLKDSDLDKAIENIPEFLKNDFSISPIGTVANLLLPEGQRWDKNTVQHLADIQANFNARQYEETPIDSVFDKSVWGNENLGIIEKLSQGIAYSSLDPTKRESLIYLLNTAPEGVASLAASISQMALTGNALKLAGVPANLIKKIQAVSGSVGEATVIAKDVENKIKEQKLEELVGEDWKKASEQAFEQAFQEAKANGENDRFAEEAGNQAKRELINQFLASEDNADIRRKVEDAAFRGRNITVGINLLTTGTNYIQVSTTLKNLERLGTKVGINAAQETIEGGTRNILAKPFVIGTSNLYNAKATLKNLGIGLENFGTEAIEEGLINPMAERFGIELGMDREYRMGDFWKEVKAGEYLDDAFWGGIFGHGAYHGGAAANSIKGAFSYKSRKKAYEAQQEILKQWDKISKAAGTDLLSELVNLNDNIHTIAKLDRAAKKAEQEGNIELAKSIEERKITVQAGKAFKSGTTEKLLEAYQTIADNTENTQIRDHALNAIQKVKKLEKLYTNAAKKEYLNVEEVFMNTAQNDQLNNNLNEMNLMLRQAKASAEQVLTSIQKDYNAIFAITENGIVFDGEQKQEFKDAVLNDAAISQFQKIFIAKEILSAAITKNLQSFAKITSKGYQQEIQRINEVASSIRRNKNLFTLEDKKDFMREVELVMAQKNLKEVNKEQIRKVFAKEYDVFNVQKQLVESLAARSKNKDATPPKKGIASVFSKFRNRIEAKRKKKSHLSVAKKEKVDMLPAELDEEMDDATKQVIKEQMAELISNEGDNPTFEQLINTAIQSLEGETAEDTKKTIEEDFNVYVLGWRLNNKELTDEEAVRVYNKFFTKRTRLSTSITKKAKKTQQEKTEPPIELEKVIGQEIANEVVTEQEIKKPVNPVAVQRLGIPTVAWITVDDIIEGKDSNDIISHRLADPTRNNPGDPVTVVAYNEQEEKGNYKGKITFPNGKKGNIFTFWENKLSPRTSHSVTGTEDSSSTTTVKERGNKITFEEKHKVSNNKKVIKLYKTYDNKKDKITEHFLVKDDQDVATLNADNIQEVRLYSINLSDTGEAVLKLKIIHNDDTTETKDIVTYNDKNNYQPLLIKDSEGNNLAWVASPKYTAMDRATMLRTAEFRRKVINAGGTFQTTIAKKIPQSQGGVVHSHTINNTPLSEVCPTAIPTVYKDGAFRIGEESFENEERVITNLDRINPSSGYTYDMRLIGYNEKGQQEYIACANKMMPELAPEAFSTVMWVLKTYLSKHDKNQSLSSEITKEQSQKIIDFFKKNFKIDVTSQNGLEQILSMFINLGSAATREKTQLSDGNISPKRFEEYLNSQPKGKPVLLMSNTNLFFGVAGQKINGENYVILSTGTAEKGLDRVSVNRIKAAMQALVATGSKLPLSNNIKMAGNEMPMPIIDNNGNPSTKGKYSDWLKTRLLTTTRATKLKWKDKDGNDIYTSRHTAVIELNEEQAIPVKPTERIEPKPDDESLIEEKTQDEITLIKKLQVAFTELGITDLNSLLDTVDYLPESQEDAFLRTVNPIPGVNLQQLHEMVNNLFNRVVSEHNNERFTDEQIRSYTKGKELFEKHILPTREKYIKLIQEVTQLYETDPVKYSNFSFILMSIQNRLNIYDVIEEHFSEVETRVAERLRKYSGIKIEGEDQTGDEQDKVYSKSSEENLLKDSITSELRRFFAGITDVNEKGTVYGFLGLENHVNFNKAFDTVASILGTAPTSSMNFTDAINILSEYTDAYPWMEGFINKIKDADEQMKNMFIYNCVNQNLNMKFLMYYWEKGQLQTRVYDTNSSEISNIIRDGWVSGFMKSDLVKYEKSIDENVINKAKAQELVDKFNTWKDKHPSNDELILWLSEVGITLSDQTINQIREYGLDLNGRVLSFNDMFGDSEKSAGLFGGIAYKLKLQAKQERTIIDEKGNEIPFSNIKNTIKEIAKIEAKFSNRTVTISFRDGDKSISGLIPMRFASDKIQALKWNIEERNKMLNDPFSRHSMLLNLINRSNDVRDAVYVNQLGVTAMKTRGQSSDSISITDLSAEDQEFVQLGFFWDRRQGKVPVSYWTSGRKNTSIPLRMANMFFPVMSDKSQMLSMYMPVLDLNSAHFKTTENGKIIIHDDVLAILFEQLVRPELGRIIENAKKLKSGSESNCAGYDLGAQIFQMIPELNNVTVTVEGREVSLVKLLNENPEAYPESWVLNDPQAKERINNVLLDLIDKEVNSKLEDWKRIGITKENKLDGSQEVAKISGEYLSETGFTDLKHIAADFVINNLISMSNIFQLVAGDLAFYSQDKLYNDFGYNKDLTRGIVGFENINSYADLQEALKSERESLTDEQYNYIKSNAKPLAYEPTSKNAYVKLSESLGTNLGKRLALLLTPGKRIATSKNNAYIQVFLNDVAVPASNFSFLIKTFYGKDALTDEVKELISNNDTKAIVSLFPKLKAFEKIDSTDAQEYTTLLEHIDVLYGKGRLSTELYNRVKEKALSQMKDGLNDNNRIDDEDFRLILQPMKPVATGSIMDEKNKNQRMIYIKSSSFPLCAQITENTNLDNLRKVMEETQLREGKSVRACYKTGVKVGATVSGVDIYKPDLSVDDLIGSSIIIPRDNFKVQQDVPVHFLYENEDKILMGTQLMKLLFGDGVTELDIEFNGNPVKGRELLNVYNNTFKQIIDTIKNDLFKELGLNKNGIPVNQEEFMRAISKILKREAKERGYSQQSIDSLSIKAQVDDFGMITDFTFVSPLWSSSDSMRFESLLNSIITKRLIKLKLPGYSYVAGSQTGFEKKSEEDITNKSDIIYTKFYDGKGLKPKDENGNAQVFLPSRFRDTTGKLIDLFAQNEDGYIYIEKDENGNWKLKDGKIADELLSIPTFRIPTSSLVSSSFVTIAGFLPVTSGDLMIVPKELITQKGLDFDIDKEYGYHLWHYTDEQGNIAPIEQLTTLENLDDFISSGQEWLGQVKRAVSKDQYMLKKIQEMEEENSVLDELDEEEMYDVEDIMEEFDNFLHKKSNYSMQDIEKGIKDLKYAKSLKRKLLENQIIRIHNAVISSKNPEIERKVNSVLSMEFAKQQASMLEQEDKGFTTILSDRYQRKKMNLGSAGKMGIGVYSNAVTLNSLIQQSDSPISLIVNTDEGKLPLRLKIGNHEFNGNLGRYISIIQSGQLNEIFKLITDEKLRQRIRDGKISLTELSKVIDNAGGNSTILLNGIRTITEVFAERQNTATDNEKEQIMGRCHVNDMTINVDCLLSLMGFDKGNDIIDIDGNQLPASISYLILSQPVIKEYVQEMKKAKSRTGAYASEEEIINKIFEKYQVSDKQVTVTSLDTQTLYDNIFKQTASDVQVAVFNLFLNLNATSKKMGNIQKILGITGGGPNAGLGKSIFDTNSKFKRIIQLVSNQNDNEIHIANVKKLIGDFIHIKDLETFGDEKSDNPIAIARAEGYIDFGEYMIKPTTAIGHMIVNSVQIGYDTWNQFFPFEHPVINKIMDEIMRLQKSDTTKWGDAKIIELKRKIIKEIQKMLFSNPDYGVISGNSTTERRRLFKDTEDKPSLASYLQKLVDDKNPEIIANELIKKMKFDIKPNKIADVSRIIFDNTVENDFDEEYLHNSFYDLLYNERPLPDNISFDPGIKHAENPMTFGKNSSELIVAGKKKLDIRESHNEEFVQGEPLIQIINGQRYKITYLGNINQNDLNIHSGKSVSINNELGKSQLNPIEAKFAQGESKHVYKIEAVYTTTQLAKDLIAYSYLSGGIQGAIEFIKYIPLSYLETSGLLSAMREFDINDDNTFANELGTTIDGILSKMTVQYYQHNPEELPTMSLKDAGLSAVPVDEIFSFASKKENSSPMIAIPLQKSDYMVFLLGSDNVYYRIHALGTHGMSEYNIQKYNPNSILTDRAQPQMLTKLEPSRRRLSNKNVNTFGIENGDSRAVLERIAKEGNEYEKKLATELLKYDNDVKLTVENIYAAGVYSHNNHTITISTKILSPISKKWSLGNNNNQDKIASVFLHEYIHSLTARELNNYFDDEGNLIVDNPPQYIVNLQKIFLQARTKLNVNRNNVNDVRNKMNNSTILTEDERGRIYPFVNVGEFVAQLMSTDTQFREKLAELQYEGEDKSLLDKFREFINDLLNSLGVNTDENMLKAAQIATLDFIASENAPVQELPELTEEPYYPIMGEEDEPFVDILNPTPPTRPEMKYRLLAQQQSDDMNYIEFLHDATSGFVYRLVTTPDGKLQMNKANLNDKKFSPVVGDELNALTSGSIKEFIIKEFGSDVWQKLKPVKKEVTRPKKIISGAQTGGDRGALLGAKEIGIETGGKMPKGFKTAEGSRPDVAKEFGLSETNSADYPQRTMENVDDSDGTMAVLWGNSVGTGKTIGYAQNHTWGYGNNKSKDDGYRPVLVITTHDVKEAAQQLKDFIKRNGIETLNVAGHREGSQPGIQEFTRQVIVEAFKEETTEQETQTREYTPDNITSLKPNEIFVFGSNEGDSRGGKPTHGRGAAKTAREKFGAIQGQSRGLQGQSYAVVTKKYWDIEKSSTLDEIKKELTAFVYFAHEHPELKFYVTKLGSSLAGYSINEIKQLFENIHQYSGQITDNIILPREYEFRDDVKSTEQQEEETQEPDMGINPSNPTTNGKTLQGEQVEAAQKADRWFAKLKEKTNDIMNARSSGILEDDIINNFMFLLSGKGGTGKTFTTEVILKQHVEGRKVTYVAPTHQAKNVLTENMESGSASTLQSLLGLKPSKDQRKNEFYALSMHEVAKIYNAGTMQIPFFDTDIIVIDEASQLGYGKLSSPEMLRDWTGTSYESQSVHYDPALGTYLMEMIKLKYQLTGRLTTVFMMGDIVQTVPINTDKYQISELLERVIKSDNFAELEKVRRVDDKDILNYNQQFRDAFFDIYKSEDRKKIVPPLKRLLLSGNFNSKNLKKLDNANQMVDTFVEHYQENISSETPNPNHTVIINYNAAHRPESMLLTNNIRKKLFGEEGAQNYYNKNELILHQGSYEYTYGGRTFNIENDDKLIIQSATEETQSIDVGKNKMFNVDVLWMSVTVKNPVHGLITIQVPYMKPETKAEINKYWEEARAKKENPGAQSTTQFRSLRANEMFTVMRALNKFNYGYVVNNYKIQGSGIDYPIVDAQNILSAGKHTDPLHLTTFIYTAVSRVRKKMYIYIEGAPTIPIIKDTDSQDNKEGMDDISSVESEFDFMLLENIARAFPEKFEQKKCNL